LEYTYLYRYNLQLFAKDGPGGEKTEPATAKKLSDARKDGKIAKSKDIISAVTLLAFFATFKYICSYMAEGFMDCFVTTYNMISTVATTSASEINYVTLFNIALNIIIDVLLLTAPVMLMVVAIEILGNVTQFKWQITWKPLQPKFDKFNPISGFKRMFSKESLINLFKSVAIVAVCLYFVYQEVIGLKGQLYNLYEISLVQAIIEIGDVLFNIGLKICLLYLIIGIIDLIYQKRKFADDMKMTKQEIKDEYKESEGDPKVKGRIRQKMRQASQRRMMQSVPEADVVITNPTHFAVALKYDNKVAEAPIVLAKGADYLAQKIKEIARENQIQIHENKPLARALYSSVEVGEQIPPELYQAVAEILAVVYRAKEDSRR